jgi:hypothetical protein
MALKDVIKNKWRQLFPPPLYPKNPQESDVYLVNWFRSGSLWVRSILFQLITKNSVDFNRIQEIVPDIHVSRDIFLPQNCSFPRIIKSHDFYNPKYKKVIYILRDPRDAIVSFYEFSTKGRGKNIGSLKDFLRGPYGINSWCKHLKGWRDKWDILLTYENLHQDCFSEIKKITEYLNLKITDQEVIDAINSASFSNIKNAELKGDRWKKQQHFKPEFTSARKGIIGDYKGKFNQEDLDFIKKQINKYNLSDFTNF